MSTNKTIKIGGVETFSAVDFPNKLAAAVFLQGCPWRCPFCYNTSLQNIEPQQNFVWQKFLAFLEQRKGLLEAVVFSGGEPLLQDAVLNAIDDVKKLGYLIGFHTGGYRPKLFEKVLEKVDWVGFDIKAPFEEEKYKTAVGGISHLNQVLQSLDMLLASGKDFECRTTCDPRILDVKDIYTIADSLKNRGVKKYHLQKYRPIESDTLTQDSDCEKFMTDSSLTNYLKSNFKETELRK
ncbi:MAG: anaerobic ribonucleoside-triphosphate reductase activating protein [Lactobacillus sp.]|jgi:anaerobic ribonucleoside-triphosphate reductase activating protein|nr:anaerobic ribonucleoside-triphosphate reductase activating protein [Lactobacillus sp.]